MPHFGRDLVEDGEIAGLLGEFAYDRHLHKEMKRNEAYDRQQIEQMRYNQMRGGGGGGGPGGGSACQCGCGGYSGMMYQPYPPQGYGYDQYGGDPMYQGQYNDPYYNGGRGGFFHHHR